MREDQARDVLSRVGAQAGPPLGVDVDGLVRRGQRIRRTRRRLVVVGAPLATSAVVLAVVLLAARQPGNVAPVVPANIPTSSATLSAVPTSGTGLSTGPSATPGSTTSHVTVPSSTQRYTANSTTR